MPVGIADRDVERLVVVLGVHRHNLWRREAMDRRDDRSRDQPGVGERQEVEAVVDDVELGRPLEDLRDVQALGNLRVDGSRPPTSLGGSRCTDEPRSPNRQWRRASRRGLGKRVLRSRARQRAPTVRSGAVGHATKSVPSTAMRIGLSTPQSQAISLLVSLLPLLLLCFPLLLEGLAGLLSRRLLG